MIKKHQPQTLGTHYKKAFKFRFYPESEDIVALQQTFGCARFVYNKVLDYSIKHYASRQHTVTDDYGDLIIIPNMKYKPLSSTDRINYITELKILYPWLKEVTSIALQQSIIGLNNAYNKFFDNVKKIKGSNKNKDKVKSYGYPNFKKRGGRNSFKILGKASIHFNKDGSFTLPKFKKPLKIKFSRGFNKDKVSSVTIIKEPSGHYYISFLSEDNYKRLPSINNKIGFDSGISNTFTSYSDSNNNNISNNLNNKGLNNIQIPDLSSIIKKIKDLNRSMSKKMKGSNNRNKARAKLAKAYEKKNNIVNDFYHKLSSTIVNENQVIIGENLNIAQMKSINNSLINNSLINNDLNNKKLKNIRSSLQNISLGKLYNYIEYKSKWYGKTFIKADKYYPSSKLCSQPNCGYINHALKLEDRAWQCPDCGTRHDRDHNSAVNLYNYDENNAKVVIKKVLAYHSKMKKNNIGLNIKSDITNSLQLTQYKNKSAPGTVVDAYGEHVILKSNLGRAL